MNGKDKCKFLKGIRKRTAEANGIPYEPKECTYEGDCTGTCSYCEKEAAELIAMLKKKEAEGAEIKKDDVGIIAIQILKDCNSNDSQETDGEEKDMEGEILQGDITESHLPPIPPVDPFTGPKNPIISVNGLRELRKHLNREREPLMGDIPSPFDEKLRKEENLRLEKEELERLKREQMEPLMGELQLDEKGKKQSGFISKIRRILYDYLFDTPKKDK